MKRGLTLVPLAGVASYALNDDDTVRSFNVVGHSLQTRPYNKFFKDTRPIIRGYTPDLSIASLKDILGGRAVSDGILVRHPYAATLRGKPIVVYHNPDYFTLSDQYKPLVYRGYQTPINTLTDGYYVLAPNAAVLFFGGQQTKQTFWVTEEHLASEAVREVVELKLNAPQLVNHVSLEVSKFPHEATVQAFDEITQEWVNLHSFFVQQSYPERISKNITTSDVHPYHNFSNHFQKVNTRTSAIRTERIRVVLRRQDSRSVPRKLTRKRHSVFLSGKKHQCRLSNHKTIRCTGP